MMDKEQLLEQLNQVRPMEQMCRDYQLEHGAPMTSEQFKEKIHHHGPHRPQKGNIRITPENQYIGVSDDIALNKHPFYIP
ncbi:MAG: hypothetical protein HFE85_05050, partial [Clostridiales bacterium]|nr:hypothetical protein [Clostridiales bacterium]